jgi:predicted regulator of Ras-like GTPase activity (Roadblock/LC7/MglB family)
MPREYREQRLTRVLREQLYEKIEGLQEAVIVTNQGLVVATYPGVDAGQKLPEDAEGSHWIAALAAEIIAQSRRAFGQLDQGSVRRILIEGDAGSMIVIPAGDDACLAAMVDPRTKLGVALFQMGRVAEQIGAILS